MRRFIGHIIRFKKKAKKPRIVQFELWNLQKNAQFIIFAG